MALKPNYGQQRADRNRAKQEKKDRKLRAQQEQTELRKAVKKDDGGVTPDKD
jgi:hypothetical protein